MSKHGTIHITTFTAIFLNCYNGKSWYLIRCFERIWGLMHRHITHNKCYATFREFSIAMLTFLRDTVPANWDALCDEVTDNFRVISPTDYRIIA